MLYKILLLVTGLGLFTQLTAQVEPFEIRATILPVGVSSEFGLGEKMTAGLNAGLIPSFGFSVSSNDGGTNSDSYFAINPYVNGIGRYFYNFEKRETKGKKTSGNSGNYVGLSGTFIGKSLNESDKINENLSFFSAGPVWGLQRTYDSNIYLDLNLGVGFYNETDSALDQSNSTLGGIGGFSLGYAF